MIVKPIDSHRLSTTVYRECDIFCCVIDNFGDAGVCLRLAKQLVSDYGVSVRLWCDDLDLLKQLEPMPSAHLNFLSWNKHITATPAALVICGFGCTVSEAYLIAMTGLNNPPRYIHLDYLSAEAWVESTHGLYSIHPRLGLKQWFCNPGFNQRTGGLLKPTMKLKPTMNVVHKRLSAAKESLRIFCFAYDLPPLYAWIDAVKQFAIETQQLIEWVLPHTAASESIERALCNEPLHRCHRLPFLSQTLFDETLNNCDVLWVRGEDSAMTAMFSGLPMVWQLYPQTDTQAKQDKLNAYVHTVQQAVGLDSTWCQAMSAANSECNKTVIEAGVIETISIFKHFLFAIQVGQQSLNHQKFSRYCQDNVPDLSHTIMCNV
jgi:uncharacterized repeat protein (TIGR03837 family)